MTDIPALRSGHAGTAVRDLQERLAAAGCAPAHGPTGVFDAATETAVRAFQSRRGLRVDGICGRETWSALVEAGWTLGDRLLCQRSPMLRGDDVADLQRRLNALGFDAGREDGILGPDTSAALREFQRNAGLAADAICGPATLAALDTLSRFDEGSIAAARERHLSRDDLGDLAGRSIYLVIAPGLEALGGAVHHGLAAGRATVVVDTSAASDSAMAAAANGCAAQLLLALRFGEIPGASCDYYESASFRSERGRATAAQILAELGRIVRGPRALRGRAYALLRETRMPAVVCQPAPADDHSALRDLVEHTHELGAAIVRGVEQRAGHADDRATLAR